MTAPPRLGGRLRLRYAQARDDYVLVFVLILVAIAMNMAVPLVGVGGLLVTGTQSITLLLALRTSGVTGRALLTLRLLALLPVLAVLLALALQRGVGPVYYVAMILLVLATQASIVIHEVRTRTVTVDTIMGALCVYLLLGQLFATIDACYASCFGPFFAQQGALQAGDYLYFSFITLATVGYGDLTPGPAVARVLAMTEGLLGQLYLVTVISLLVGNLGAQRLGRGSPPP